MWAIDGFTGRLTGLPAKGIIHKDCISERRAKDESI